MRMNQIILNYDPSSFFPVPFQDNQILWVQRHPTGHAHFCGLFGLLNEWVRNGRWDTRSSSTLQRASLSKSFRPPMVVRSVKLELELLSWQLQTSKGICTVTSETSWKQITLVKSHKHDSRYPLRHCEMGRNKSEKKSWAFDQVSSKVVRIDHLLIGGIRIDASLHHTLSLVHSRPQGNHLGLDGIAEVSGFLCQGTVRFLGIAGLQLLQLIQDASRKNIWWNTTVNVFNLKNLSCKFCWREQSRVAPNSKNGNTSNRQYRAAGVDGIPVTGKLLESLVLLQILSTWQHVAQQIFCPKTNAFAQGITIHSSPCPRLGTGWQNASLAHLDHGFLGRPGLGPGTGSVRTEKRFTIVGIQNDIHTQSYKRCMFETRIDHHWASKLKFWTRLHFAAQGGDVVLIHHLTPTKPWGCKSPRKIDQNKSYTKKKKCGSIAITS